MRHTSLILVPFLLTLAACADQPTSPTPPAGAGIMQAAKPPAPTDPTATWIFPAMEAGLGFASDGQGAYSDGACGVSTRIFATTAGSNSGDATLQTNKVKNCIRRFTLRYSATPGDTEVVPSFNNLLKLQTSTAWIPIGTSVRRRLIVSPGALANNPSRCGRVLFGPNGAVGLDSDSVNVTRVDASTWAVQSTGTHQALCEANNTLYTMPVSFTVVSSSPLPL